LKSLDAELKTPLTFRKGMATAKGRQVAAQNGPP
jgi:hypothetical protein